MPIRCEVVSVERVVYDDDADIVVAPGIEGELGILPHHAALMTALVPGEIVIRKAGEETHLAVGGGFMEVRPDRVTILADSAEKAEEIDIARADAARQRAEQLLSEKRPGLDLRAAEYALRRSQVRLKVAHRRRADLPPAGPGNPSEHGEP